MISSIIPVGDTGLPVARTNMLQLEPAGLEVVLEKLLQPVHGSELYVNCRILQLPYQRVKKDGKEVVESREDYSKRVDANIRGLISRDVGANTTGGIHYNRLQAKKDITVFAYLGRRQQAAGQIVSSLQAAGASLFKAVSAIINLRLKMDFLLDASREYEIRPIEFNSELFVGVIHVRTSDKKENKKSKPKNTKIFDALKPEVYLSEKMELVLEMKRQVFVCGMEAASSSVVDGTELMFHFGNKRYVMKGRLDARNFSRSRKYIDYATMKEGSKKESQYHRSINYHENDCLNRIERMLNQVGVAYSPIRFRATHWVRKFLTPEKTFGNPLVVIDDYQGYRSADEQAALHSEIMECIRPQRIITSKEAGSPNLLPTEGVNYLVINQMHEDGSSISDRKKGVHYKTFWEAYRAIQKGGDKGGSEPADLDFYTQMKFARFEGGKPFVCQGYNLGRAAGGEESPEQGLLLNKPAFERIPYEIWLKEGVFSHKQLVVSGAQYAPRRIELLSCRRGADGQRWIEIADVELNGGDIRIHGVNRYDKAREGEFNYKYPSLAKALSNFEKSSYRAIYNESFMIHDVETGCWLNTYKSSRVPQIIGNAAFDNVQAHLDGGVFKTVVEDKSPLPYYLTRRIDKQTHSIFLQDAGSEGVRFFVVNAQPPQSTLLKRDLMYNVLIYGPNGEWLPPLGHPLTEVYFSSFTYDLLRLRESSKTTILEKVIDLHLEN